MRRHRRPGPAAGRPAAAIVALCAGLAVGGIASDAAAAECSAAGMAIDAVYCADGTPSLLDRRIEFLRAVAGRVLPIEAYDRLLADDKGAIDIIRETCAAETEEAERRACHATVLIDRLYEIEARIVAALDERLAAPAPVTGIVPGPDGSPLTSFLAAIEATAPVAVFAGPDGVHLLGEVAAGERAVVTGVLLRSGDEPSLFRILWQHGTVAWTPVDGWRFDAAQLIGGVRNLPPSYQLAQVSQRARLACIEAALAALAPDSSGNFLGPWPAADGSFYARLEFPDAASVDCVASPDLAPAIAIARLER